MLYKLLFYIIIPTDYLNAHCILSICIASVTPTSQVLCSLHVTTNGYESGAYNSEVPFSFCENQSAVSKVEEVHTQTAQ